MQYPQSVQEMMIKPTKSSTDEKLRYILRVIQFLFLLQITFGFFIPTIDTFLDLGDGFHSFIFNLYSYAQKNNIALGNNLSKEIIRRNSTAIVQLGYHLDDTICIPGAGFSGFWFSLGRLHALEHNTTLKKQNRNISKKSGVLEHKGNSFVEALIPGNGTCTDASNSSRSPTKTTLNKYQCFSAGCLVIVAVMINYTVTEVMDMALEAQNLWLQGKIRRYDVVEYFVNALLNDYHPKSLLCKEGEGNWTNHKDSILTNESLSRIHIITTGLNWDDSNHSFLRSHSRSPENMRDLKELLIQTTWIPFVTGESLWRRDEVKGDYHMDGAFSVPLLRQCTKRMNLPIRTDLLFNALNPDLEKSKALEFYNLGLEHESV